MAAPPQACQIVMNNDAWEPLECTPDTFNILAKGLGLDTERWHFVDVLGLDDELLSLVPPGATALILLYPTTDKDIEQCLNRVEPDVLDVPSNVVFLRQLVGGSCGTIAVVHAVTNSRQCHDAVSPSSPFAELIDNSGDTDSKSRWFVESESVRNAHQATVKSIVGTSSQMPLAGQRQGRHFIAFVNQNDHLLELNGRNNAPICRGTTSSISFLRDTAKEIQKIVASTRDSSVHVRCSLVALVPTSSS